MITEKFLILFPQSKALCVMYNYTLDAHPFGVLPIPQKSRSTECSMVSFTPPGLE